jgi:hypothetical protein
MLLVFNTMVALWWVGYEESEANKKIEFYSRALSGADNYLRTLSIDAVFASFGGVRPLSSRRSSKSLISTLVFGPLTSSEGFFLRQGIPNISPNSTAGGERRRYNPTQSGM